MTTSSLHFDCLQFRRDKLADPRHLPASAQAHQEHCSLCQAYARRIDQAEIKINQTLNVAIPEGLAERAILRATRGQKIPARPWKSWAMAASVLLCALIGSSLYWRQNGVEPLSIAQAAAQHMQDEADEMAAHSSERVERFGPILASFGGQLQAPVGDVRYIQHCPIPGHGMGWHIVYDTPQGAITLLLVNGKPGEPDTQTLDVQGRMIRVQRAGQGYYALISHNRAGLDAAHRDLQTKVRWL